MVEELRRRFLTHVTSGDEPVVLSSEGVGALQSHLHSLIGTPAMMPAVAELASLAEIALKKQSPGCASELLALADAVLATARVMGDAAADRWFGQPSGDEGAPLLDRLRARHQVQAPAEHWYRPITIDFEITQKCNLRCESCAIIEEVERGYDGLSGDDAVRILKSCEGTSISSYSVMGGEPFLRIDDLCRMIREVDLDLNRIQTNAKVFSSRSRADELLGRLADAGLMERNRELRPSINVSIGIQTDAGAPLANTAHLIASAVDLFGDRIAFVLNLLPHDRSDPRLLIPALSEAYYRTAGAHLPWSQIAQTYLVNMEYTPRAAKAGAVDGRFEPMRERFLREEADTCCPNFAKRFEWSITPRCLVRADRTFFACSCFGYAGCVGVVEDSVVPLIERANGDLRLRRVFEGGLVALYQERVREDPSWAERSIPREASVCKVCKALREPDQPLYAALLPVI